MGIKGEGPGGGGTGKGQLMGVGNLAVGGGGHGSKNTGTGGGSRVVKEVHVGMTTGNLSSEGGLSKEQIQKVVESHRAALLFCYEKELQRFPTFPEARRPLFMRVTLAMQDEFVDEATTPTHIWLDYVRAYARL